MGLVIGSEKGEKERERERTPKYGELLKERWRVILQG